MINAKTFKRADLELKKMWEIISHPSVKEYFGGQGIQWKNIAERGAWWGGFWERMIKSVKLCLRKVLGKTSLSIAELETVLIETEAVINSRPITFVYNDPQEPSPLTPAHFLVERRLLALPAVRIENENVTSARQNLIKTYN